MNRYFVFVISVVISFFIFSCNNGPLTPPSTEDSGGANVNIKVGQAGSLAKTADIEFKKLCMSLSAIGENTIYDTIALSGYGQVIIPKVYTGLASQKTWTLSAHSFDANDSLIHNNSVTFIVRPRQTTTVILDLSARFSMLKATFKPIRDSVTRCELLIDGVNKADSLFAKQSLIGSSLRLGFDYLRTGIPQVVVMNVYGDMWGIDTLLYTGSIMLTPISGNNSSFKIDLRWVGPKNPPPGQATMTVTLGPVGTIDVEGDLLGKYGMLFGRGQVGSSIYSLWLMDADGTNQRKIYECETAINSACFHPDSSRLLVAKNSSVTGRSEIYSVPFNGELQANGAASQLTNDNGQYGSTCPQFVNGKIWYVVGPSAGNSEIIQIDLDGSNRVQLTNFAARGKQVGIFKIIGDKILYHLQSPSWAPTAEIYLANLDFTGEVQLTSNGEVDAWASANKSLTLFVASHSDGGPYGFPHNIYSFDATGGSRTKLTFEAGGGSGYMESFFSPDDGKIACNYVDNGNQDIVLMSIDGSGMVNLTNTQSQLEVLFDWK